MRVLVVDDDASVANAVALALRHQGMAVDIAGDGAAALERALDTDYDVVLLDWLLPQIDGAEVCRRLVSASCRARIIMLTQLDDQASIVVGLDCGADDYVIKPFCLTELTARVRAVARRANPALPPVLRWGDIEIDPARHCASRGGRPLALGAKEFAVLEVLMGANGRVVSAEELLERVWDASADPFSSAVKVTVSRLRAKLGSPAVIETIPSVGYRIPADAQVPSERDHDRPRAAAPSVRFSGGR